MCRIEQFFFISMLKPRSKLSQYDNLYKRSTLTMSTKQIRILNNNWSTQGESGGFRIHVFGGMIFILGVRKRERKKILETLSAIGFNLQYVIALNGDCVLNMILNSLHCSKMFHQPCFLAYLLLSLNLSLQQPADHSRFHITLVLFSCCKLT